MATVKLLQNEAKIVEALKKTQNIPAIAKEIGIAEKAAYYILKRIVDFGMIERTGNKRHYKHTVRDIPYEIVDKRVRPRSEVLVEEDGLVQEAMGIELTQEQLYYLKQHRNKLKRTILAKRLGLTKLQLNFVLVRLEGRAK